MTSWKKPTDQQIDRIVSLAHRPALSRRFFLELNNPLWAEELERRGFYKNPPEPEVDETDRTIRFPDWPETKYLVTISGDAPAVVADVVASIPDTENVRVHMDFLLIARAIPQDLGKAILEREIRWIENQEFLYLNYAWELTKSLEYCLRNELTSTGLKLVRAAFFPIGRAEKSSYSAHRAIRVRVADSDFCRCLEKITEMLIQANSLPGFYLISEILAEFVRLSSPDDTDGFDRSYSTLR